MDVRLQGGLQQGSGADTPNLLPQGNGVPGGYSDLLGQTGIFGGVATFVTDDHGGTHGFVVVDGVDGAVSGSQDRGPFFRGDVHTVVDPPVPGGLIIAERFHGILCHGLAVYPKDILKISAPFSTAYSTADTIASAVPSPLSPSALIHIKVASGAIPVAVPEVPSPQIVPAQCVP